MSTKKDLLEVTARLFASHGWRGTTTRRIAEEAGVNEVTVFRLFKSKEALEEMGASADLIADYLERVEDYPVLPRVAPGDVGRALPAAPPDAGEPLDRLLDEFADSDRPALQSGYSVDGRERRAAGRATGRCLRPPPRRVRD